MPVPKVTKGTQSKERKRTRSGRWRKKRSDAGQKRNRTKEGRAKPSQIGTLSVDEVLTAVKTEKISAAVTIGVQPSLLEYATQVAEKRGRSTWLRRNVIENIRRKREEELEGKHHLE